MKYLTEQQILKLLEQNNKLDLLKEYDFSCCILTPEDFYLLFLN